MFLNSVWVVEVHTFFKDGLKDILLEQSAHILSNMSLRCVMGINGLLMGSSVCMQRGLTLEARVCLKLTLTASVWKEGMEVDGRLVAQGVKTRIWL